MINNNKKIIENYDFDIYPSGYQNSHSYRIPSLLKLKSGKLIAIVDQRIESQLDAPYTTINQIMRTSDDNGETWTEGKIIIKLEKTRESKASAIDGVILEDEIHKELYFAVDVFPGGSGLMPVAKLMNPLGSSDLGFNKYKKIYSIENDKKMVLKPFEKENWFRVFEVIDGNWNNHNESNYKALNIIINNSFDSKTGILHASVFENAKTIKDTENKKPICSLFDGFDNRDPNYDKPKYYLESTAYLYLFKSQDEGQTWQLIQDITNQVKHKNDKINCLVLGPGQGLFLKNQKSSNKNSRIIFPFYEVNYALPSHAYFAYSDDKGLTWKPSEYINPDKSENWHWLSETQVVENSNGILYAYMRNPEQGQICVSKSLDAGHTWLKLDESEKGFTVIKHSPLNGQIMHGVTNFVYKNKDYHLLTLPTTPDRKNGQLFIIDSEFKMHLISNITDKDNSFGYSAIQVLEQKDDEITLGILYEVSKIRNQGLSWVGFDSKSTANLPDQSEILFKKIKIKI